MSNLVDRKYLGIFFACASYGLYSMHYATVKWLQADISLWQLMFMRSAVLVLIALLVSRRGTFAAAIRTPNRGSIVVRGVLQFASGACFFLAARSMPLSAVMTLYSTAPLIIVVLSIFVLGEQVRGYRWLALIVGVAGSVVAANPGGEMSFTPALSALASGLFWAVTVVYTRKNGARDSSAVQLLVTGLVFLVCSALLMTWQSPSSTLQWSLMIVLGVQMYLAQYFFFEACRLAPASLVGPIEYSGVAWSCVLDYLIFADIPTPHIVIGSLLVAISAIALAVSANSRYSRKGIKVPPALPDDDAVKMDD